MQSLPILYLMLIYLISLVHQLPSSLPVCSILVRFIFVTFQYVFELVLTCYQLW